MALAEARRRDYLAALGVPLWVARHPLPGARAGAWTRASTVPAPVPAAPERVAPPAPVPQTKAPPRAAPATTPVAARDLAREVASEAAPSACLGWLLADQRVVLLAVGDAPDLSAAGHALWQQLRLAMGWSGARALGRFDWPLPYARHLAADVDARREALQGWLTGVVGMPVDRWLVFGAAAMAGLPAGQCRLLPGLEQMLREPACKRACWQALLAT